MRISQLLVAWSALAGLKEALSKRSDPRGELRYHVPPGQDAAAALAAVWKEGLSARVAIDGGYEDVVVACDPVDDRERVRAVLRGAPVGMAGERIKGPPILFADEQPG
jgi:hypothetical protein